MSLFVVFEGQKNEVYGCCSPSVLLNFWECEAFAGNVFLILLSSVWTSNIFSHLILKTFISIGKSPGNKHS